MARDLESLGPAETGQDHRDLLQELIAEGLSFSADQTDSDTQRYRRLLTILFDACILRPSFTSPSQSSFEQVSLTLKILLKQCSSQPGLLSRLPSGDEPQTPLFKWVLPRLIDAASRFVETDVGDQLFDDLVDAAVIVIGLLRKDDLKPGDGPVLVVLGQLQQYCRDVKDNKPLPLFGYNMQSPIPSLLAILKILVKVTLPFTDELSTATCTLITECAPVILRHTSLQPQYVATLLLALRSAPFPHSLYPACTILVTMPKIDLKPFFAGVTVHSDLRYELWRKIRDQEKGTGLTVEEDELKVLHLLTPIEGVLSSEQIKTSLVNCEVDRFAQEIEEKMITSMTAKHILRLIRQEAEPSADSRKRKRNGEAEPADPAFELLRAHLPSQELVRESYMKNLISFVYSSDENAAALVDILPQMYKSRYEHDMCSVNDEINLWHAVIIRTTGKGSAWQALDLVLKQYPTMAPSLTTNNQVYSTVSLKLGSRDRRDRIMAGRAVCRMFAIMAPPTEAALRRQLQDRTMKRFQELLAQPLPMRETTVATIGALGRQSTDDWLCTMLELLLQQLGSSSSALRSLAMTELLDIAKSHGKTPYALIYPFLDRISVTIVRNIRRRPDVVSEAMHFLGQHRSSFVQTTMSYTLPALVLATDKQALEAIAPIVGRNLREVLLDRMTEILTQVYLDPRRTLEAMNFLVGLMREGMDQNASQAITSSTLIASCHMTFAVTLIIELGDEDPQVVQTASRALRKAQAAKESGKGNDLGAFLKPVMLGILTQLNDTLHDMRGKKTVAFKCKLIRSLGALIELVGDSMSAYSPQIMQSLQSTLVIPELRLETLNTWATFVNKMKFADFGPFVGRTTGALVANWADFDEEERETATSIIAEIAGNAKDLKPYLDEIVGLEGIPELADAAKILMAKRRKMLPQQQLQKVLERASSQNTAIATTSMRELRSFLLERHELVAQFSLGDSFDPLIPTIVRTLLAASTREGDCDALRHIAYECLGIVGALDPDRFTLPTDPPPMTILSNFTDAKESQEFAIHLVRDVLVDAFRATNDTKLQSHLAYAMQELLNYCGFDSKLLSTTTAVPMKTRTKWNSLPKDQLEVLAPLLESRFSLGELPLRKLDHPIYFSAPSYRDWLHMWTTDLIGRVMSEDLLGTAQDCQRIFGAFRGVLRNQDVMVAHHLLPHLVLHVLLSGDHGAYIEIKQEINVVLQDQVTGVTAGNKRMFSAQLIFDLMDHLSRWLRLQQNNQQLLAARISKATRTLDENERIIVSRQLKEIQAQIDRISHVLSEIDSHLVAHAALQSKAYARSLRNFEQRIILLRSERRDDDQLQVYFERLHQIYAELEEPDGMEGVSTFVISPSLEHQIREHESTGRWTSAQSCWEVRLQQSPDDVSLHIGLLKCLQNLGHYDTLRTHIRGVLSRRPDWSTDLAEFQAEAAWITGDWEKVEALGELGRPMGPVLLGLQQNRPLPPLLETARQQIGQNIISREYGRVYDVVLKLHQLREIELIHNMAIEFSQDQTHSNINRAAISRKRKADFIKVLDGRFDTTSPTFRVREAILTIRRTALHLVDAPELRGQVGQAWIQSSRIARKAGYEQTAYTAALQARECDAPFAFVQQVKLLKGHDGVFKALTSLENSVKLVLSLEASKNEKDEDPTETFMRDRQLAKAVLLEARWAKETDRFESNEVIGRFHQAIQLDANLESPYYHLGHYYDTIDWPIDAQATANYQTCLNYIQALHRGVKYIYQTMPRMLTLWLDLGESDQVSKKSSAAVKELSKITSMVNKARGELPAYQFLTAFPQIVSRIGHPKKEISGLLRKVMALVIQEYPKQAMWPTVGVMQSNRADRKQACMEVLHRAQGIKPNIAPILKEAERLSGALLQLSNDKTDEKKREISIATAFPYVKKVFPSKMIMPLQDALTPSLPISADMVKSHNPFPTDQVLIDDVMDKVEVMPSLQKPKKIVFRGTDGKMYPMLCKPHDDLRKDARLMDFNSMINKLLKSASESRRRQLYIRTYAVMPLNEECGLLEWVSNTNALKRILEKEYARQGKKIYSNELHVKMDTAKRTGPKAQIKTFKEEVLPMFSPSVFHNWFLTTWPEPTAWLASRMAYSRTLAVMSMIGHVLGLGDRHGENILFDGTTGDTVHVDLNCLFEKGKTFEIPEKVPFRLTHNMVDALGVTGIEGVFRKAAEITMSILRSNSDSLMSVLEAFAHDPLVEWSSRSGKIRTDKDIRSSADRNLAPIRAKLRGQSEINGMVNSVPRQVDMLIKEATSASNLAVMYQGWAPYL